MKQYVFSDDLLKKLMTEACEKDLNEYTAYGVADGQNSEYGNGDRMFAVAGGVPVQAAAQRSGKRLRTVIRRVVLLVAVALLLVASTISAVDQVDNSFIKISATPAMYGIDTYNVYMKNTITLYGPYRERKSGWPSFENYAVDVPDGYSATEETYNEVIHQRNVQYECRDGSFLFFEQCFAEEFHGLFSAENEPYHLAVNNSPGVLLPDGDWNVLIWTDGVYGFCLSGQFSKDELLEMAATCKKIDE